MNVPWGLERDRFIAVICCCLCTFLCTFAIVTVSSNLGLIQRVFDADYSTVSSFSQIIAVSYVTFFLVAIALTDRFGKRRSLVSGLVILCVTSLMCAVTKDMRVLTVFRLLSGLGITLMQTSCISIITDVVEKKYLGEALALAFSFSSIGAIFAPLTGMLVTDAFGLSSLFVIVGVMALVLAIPIRGIENRVTDERSEIDWVSHILYIVSVSLIISMLLYGWTDLRWVLLSVGIVLFVIFIIVHHGSRNKIMDIEIFGIREFVVGVALSFIFIFAMGGVENALSQSLQFMNDDFEVFGIMVSTTAFASVLIGMKPAIQAFISPMVAKHYRDRETSTVPIIGMVLLLVSVTITLVLTKINVMTVLFVSIIAIYVIHAVSNSLFTPNNRKVIMSSVPERDRNTASSILSLINTTASISGMVILSNLTRGSSSLETFKESSLVLFLIVGIVCAAGVFIAIRSAREN